MTPFSAGYVTVTLAEIEALRLLASPPPSPAVVSISRAELDEMRRKAGVG